MNKLEKKELLDPNSNVSSMRWALVELIPVIKWMLITTPLIAAYQIYNSGDADWIGLASYITAQGAFITGLLWTKSAQKKNELK